VIDGGMIPKVGGAVKALEFGVRKVHFIDAHTDRTRCCSNCSPTRGSGPKSSFEELRMTTIPSSDPSTVAEVYKRNLLLQFRRRGQRGPDQARPQVGPRPGSGALRGHHVRNSFHGRTLATLTATGQDKIQKGFEPLPGICLRRVQQPRVGEGPDHPAHGRR
jgi:hypothetical protein